MVCPPPLHPRACAQRVGELLTGLGYGGHYDLILSSETIYSVQSQERLLECIKQVGRAGAGRARAAGLPRGTRPLRAHGRARTCAQHVRV